MSNKTSEPSAIDGAFLRALQEHRGGAILTDLAEAMRKAVEAAQRVGKTASLSLDVTFSPNGNAIAFAAEVSVKLPKEPPYAGIFFADESCNLFRNDPMQKDLAPLKTIETDTAETADLRKAVNE